MRTHKILIWVLVVFLLASFAYSQTCSINSNQIIFSQRHACAITPGNIYCLGANYNGQLGDGTLIDRTTPVVVSEITNAVQVSAGFLSTCALLSDRTVKCWGHNSYGQLGDGTQTQRTIPVQVSGITNAVQVSAGFYHVCALLSDKTIKCWGYGTSGQLGNGNTPSASGPVQVSVITNAVQVSAGTSHTCAVLSNGIVNCWGLNNYGQLGDGTIIQKNIPVQVSGITNAVQVSAGADYTCAVLSDNTVKCWGRNNYGMLGDGTTTASSTPVLVSGITNAVQVRQGLNFACALLSDKTIKCWGYNGNGELGDGTTVDKSTPVQVLGITNAVQLTPSMTSTFGLCVLKSDSNLQCWGSSNPYSIKNLANLNPFPMNPSNQEICNGFDDNCNGQIDEGCDDNQDGCADAGKVCTGSFLDWKGNIRSCSAKCSNLLYIDDRFLSCNLADKESTLEGNFKQDVKDNNDVLLNVDGLCEIKGTWFCDNGNSRWEPLNKYSNTELIEKDKALKSGIPATEQGCCPTKWCWNSIDQTCEKSQKGEFYNPILYNFTGSMYRCMDGFWKSAYQRYDWLQEQQGYCDYADQCFVSETLNPSGKAECINPGNWKPEFKQHYCYNGSWTSRTKLIALQMINITQESAVGFDNYILFCDKIENALNNYKDYFSGFDKIPDAFGAAPAEGAAAPAEGESNVTKYDPENLNNFCVLEYTAYANGKKRVILGTSLNAAINDINTSFTGFILNKPIGYCDNTMYGRSYLSLRQTDFIDIPSINPTQKMAVEAWAKSTVNSFEGDLVSKYDAYVLGPNETDNKQMCFKVNVNGSWYSTCYNVADPSAWNHFAGTYNYQGRSLNLYFNGSLASSITLPLGMDSYFINADSGNAQVGHAEIETEGIRHFHGYIDELKIYSTDLPSSYILTEYIAGSQERKPLLEKTNLLAYYPFDNDASDYSGNAKHGTMVNNAKIIGATNEFRPCNSNANGPSDVYFNPASNLVLFSSENFTVHMTPLEQFMDSFMADVYNPFKGVSDFFVGLFTGKEVLGNYEFTQKITDFDRIFISKSGSKTVRSVMEKKFEGLYEKLFMIIEFKGFNAGGEICDAIKKSLTGKVDADKFSCESVIG